MRQTSNALAYNKLCTSSGKFYCHSLLIETLLLTEWKFDRILFIPFVQDTQFRTYNLGDKWHPNAVYENISD